MTPSTRRDSAPRWLPASTPLLLVGAAILAGCAVPWTSPPSIEGLTVQAGSADVRLQWRTTPPAFAVAEVWPVREPTRIQRSDPRAAPDSTHQARFDGLPSATEFGCWIIAAPQWPGDTGVARSPVTTFRTRARIGIASPVVQVDGTAAEVRWRTDCPTDTTVHFGFTPELERRRTDGTQGSTQDHRLRLTGLDRPAMYRLRIVATDPSGLAQTTTSDELTFATTSAWAVVEQIMPRPATGRTSLVNLSRDYLARLKNVTPEQRARIEKGLAIHDPSAQLEPTPAEKKWLATDPGVPDDTKTFRKKVDLINRWVLVLLERGVRLGDLERAGVTLANTHFLDPQRARVDLLVRVKELGELGQ